MKNETGKTWTVVITSDRNPDEFPSEPMTLRDAMKRAQECWARAEKDQHVQVVSFDDSDDVCHNLDVAWTDGKRE